MAGMAPSVASNSDSSQSSTEEMQPTEVSAEAAKIGKAAGQLPGEANAFANAIGVDTHFDYSGSPYVTSFPEIRRDLLASGIRHIRDGNSLTDETYLQRLASFGMAGINHSLSFGLSTTGAQMDAALHQLSPYVDFVEPLNEYDSYASRAPQWAAHIDAQQRLLYATVRADPSLANVVVLGPSLANWGLSHFLGPLDSIEDAANLHNSPCHYNPGTGGTVSLADVDAFVRTSTAKKPIWTTETGFSDDPTGGCFLPDTVIAKYDPRTVAVRWNAGEPRIYFYEFSDVPDELEFGHTGLVKADGAPKPQYTALKNMISLVSDPGPSFSPTPLAFSLTGGNSSVQHTLLQKRNGTYVLLLWQETLSWSPQTRAAISVRPTMVTLNLKRAPSAVSFASFNGDNSLDVRSVTPAMKMQVPVTDSISFLELR